MLTGHILSTYVWYLTLACVYKPDKHGSVLTMPCMSLVYYQNVPRLKGTIDSVICYISH